jgi:hypothetical protein
VVALLYILGKTILNFSGVTQSSALMPQEVPHDIHVIVWTVCTKFILDCSIQSQDNADKELMHTELGPNENQIFDMLAKNSRLYSLTSMYFAKN